MSSGFPPSLGVGAEDVFFSMADMEMSHSLSSLPPLGEPPTVDLDLSLNSNYSASPGESPTGNVTVSLSCTHRGCPGFGSVYVHGALSVFPDSLGRVPGRAPSEREAHSGHSLPATQAAETDL